MENIQLHAPSYMKFCDGPCRIFQYKGYRPEPLYHGANNFDAAVIGAGPSGLIAALVLANNGFNNIAVLEKRNAFNRLNFITLYPETLFFLKKLNLLSDVLKLCSPIHAHQFYIKKSYQTKFISRIKPTIDMNLIESIHPYDTRMLQQYYLGQGVLMTYLADYQDLLFRKILETNKINVYFDATAELVKSTKDIKKFSVVVNGNSYIDTPEVLIVSDGAKSKNLSFLGAISEPSKWIARREQWHITHCKLKHVEQSNLCYQFEYAGDIVESISYGLTCPIRKELGVAYCYDGVPTKEKLIKNAHDVADLHQLEIDKLSWYSKPISVTHLCRNNSVFANVILLGDAVGVGSPNAGLGTVLGTSAYGWCLDKYLKFKQFDHEKANEFYNTTTKAYVSHWHTRSAQIWQQIADLRYLS